MEKTSNLPIRNPWQIIDYASNRGNENPQPNGVEILYHLPLIDCGLGHSPFGPPEYLISFLKDLPLIESVWKYPPDKFTEEPTGLIRDRFGLSENPIIIFHGQGSYGLLAQIILELPDLTEAEEVGILGIGPQFPNIVGLAEKHGRRPDGSLRFPYYSVQPPLDLSLNSKIELLISQITEKPNGPRFIYLDNPNNPTGDFADRDQIERLVNIAQQFGHVVIVDEAYGDAIDDNQSTIPLTEQYNNLIVIRGVTKIIGTAGLRVGYGVFSKEIGEVFQSLQLVFGVSGPQQLILSQLLNNGSLPQYLTDVREKIRGIKTYLMQGLSDLGIIIPPTHPNVPIFLAIGPNDNFFNRLRRYQILVEKGSDFSKTYSLTDAAVRIRIPGNLNEANEVLKRIEQALRE